jgi:hypothetical protein
MAQIQFSSLVANVKGSVAGLTFQRCNGNQSLRKKPLPRQADSELQMQAKGYVSQVQQSWAALSVDEQKAWQAFTAFTPVYQKGNKKVALSGYQLFLKYNLIRLHTGLAVLTSITYTTLNFQVPEFDLYVDPGVSPSLYFEFDSAIDPAVYGLLIKTTPPVKGESLRNDSRLRVTTYNAITGGNLDYDIVNAYIAAFGLLPGNGDKLLCDFTLYSAIAPVIAAPVRVIATVQE